MPAIDPYAPAYRWFACNLVSGLIVDEVPIGGTTLPATIGSYQTTTASMPIPDAPAGWENCTVPGLSMLVCARESDSVIVGGGIITNREGGSASSLSLSVATCEAYLNRRYMHDATWDSADEGEIVRTLLSWANDDGIDLQIDAPDTGTQRQRTYVAADDTSIYQRLTELMGVDGGPEWTIALGWNDTQTGVTKTFRLRKQLGVQTSSPAAVFDMPGCVSDYNLIEGYTSDAGANNVLATGDAAEGAPEDTARPQSSEHVAADLIAAGWPAYETRHAYSGVSQVSTLNAHAAADLALMRLGARGVTVDAAAGAAPQYGADWTLGDTVRFEVTTSPRHPDGLCVRARATGVELDTSTSGSVSPTLLWED